MMKNCLLFFISFLRLQFSVTQGLYYSNPHLQFGVYASVKANGNFNDISGNMGLNPIRNIPNRFRSYNNAHMAAYGNIRPYFDNLQRGVGNYITKPNSSLLSPFGIGALPFVLKNTRKYDIQPLINADDKNKYDTIDNLLNEMGTFSTLVAGDANTTNDLTNAGFEQRVKAGMTAANALKSSGKMLADMGAQAIKYTLNAPKNVACNCKKHQGNTNTVLSGRIYENATKLTGGLFADMGDNPLKTGLNRESDLSKTENKSEFTLSDSAVNLRKYSVNKKALPTGGINTNATGSSEDLFADMSKNKVESVLNTQSNIASNLKKYEDNMNILPSGDYDFTADNIGSTESLFVGKGENAMKTGLNEASNLSKTQNKTEFTLSDSAANLRNYPVNKKALLNGGIDTNATGSIEDLFADMSKNKAESVLNTQSNIASNLTKYPSSTNILPSGDYDFTADNIGSTESLFVGKGENAMKTGLNEASNLSKTQNKTEFTLSDSAANLRNYPVNKKALLNGGIDTNATGSIEDLFADMSKNKAESVLNTQSNIASNLTKYPSSTNILPSGDYDFTADNIGSTESLFVGKGENAMKTGLNEASNLSKTQNKTEFTLSDSAADLRKYPVNKKALLTGGIDTNATGSSEDLIADMSKHKVESVLNTQSNIASNLKKYEDNMNILPSGDYDFTADNIGSTESLFVGKGENAMKTGLNETSNLSKTQNKTEFTLSDSAANLRNYPVNKKALLNGGIDTNATGSIEDLFADMSKNKVESVLNTQSNIASNLTKYPSGTNILPSGDYGFTADNIGSTESLFVGRGENAMKTGLNEASNLSETQNKTEFTLSDSAANLRNYPVNKKALLNGGIDTNATGSREDLIADMSKNKVESVLNTQSNIASNLKKYQDNMNILPSGDYDFTADNIGSTESLFAGKGENAVQNGLNTPSNLSSNFTRYPDNMNTFLSGNIDANDGLSEGLLGEEDSGVKTEFKSESNLANKKNYLYYQV
ncbi:uncharacterized protein LOC142333514 [Lycorma delicatula]|uniref:uncharacterized protein LOC142333514 n=1 Tax=Lycorma delicatula TaxID=130591 RepID=UPI003F5181E1